MAEALGVSDAHLAKVMQRLARAGLVRSVRGPKGGFALGRPAEKTSLLEIYEAVEGPLTDSNCLLDRPVCDGNCMLGGLLDTVNRLVRETLAGTKLCDVAVGRRRDE
jgi:Rrf2 family protein